MSKQQSFVCYGRIRPGGVQRVLYRTTITPGDDPISKNTATINAANFGTYLTNVAESNTLFPGIEVDAAVTTAIAAIVTAQVAAMDATKRNVMKVALSRVVGGVDAGKPAYTFTKVINGVKSVETIVLVD